MEVVDVVEPLLLLVSAFVEAVVVVVVVVVERHGIDGSFQFRRTTARAAFTAVAAAASRIFGKQQTCSNPFRLCGRRLSLAALF
jgi:hypothetical protein